MESDQLSTFYGYDPSEHFKRTSDSYGQHARGRANDVSGGQSRAPMQVAAAVKQVERGNRNQHGEPSSSTAALLEAQRATVEAKKRQLEQMEEEFRMLQHQSGTMDDPYQRRWDHYDVPNVQRREEPRNNQRMMAPPEWVQRQGGFENQYRAMNSDTFSGQRSECSSAPPKVYIPYEMLQPHAYGSQQAFNNEHYRLASQHTHAPSGCGSSTSALPPSNARAAPPGRFQQPPAMLEKFLGPSAASGAPQQQRRIEQEQRRAATPGPAHRPSMWDNEPRKGKKAIHSRCTESHIVFENTKYEDPIDPVYYAEHYKETDGPFSERVDVEQDFVRKIEREGFPGKAHTTPRKKYVAEGRAQELSHNLFSHENIFLNVSPTSRLGTKSKRILAPPPQSMTNTFQAVGEEVPFFSGGIKVQHQRVVGDYERTLRVLRTDLQDEPAPFRSRVRTGIALEGTMSNNLQGSKEENITSRRKFFDLRR